MHARRPERQRSIRERVDTYPNCLHASSTANIHFHGTHTSPSSTGDNVYLQVRPLPRDNQGNVTVTPAQATASLDDWFGICAQQLKNPLNQWPVNWNDFTPPYINKQIQMLTAYQQQNPSQPLLDNDKEASRQRRVAAVLYRRRSVLLRAAGLHGDTCGRRPPGSTSPNMGQSPGTHWYHAHKHGSTAINVGNGMTGVFIIEGQYDDDLDTFYSRYTLTNGSRGTSQAQPVMVLNQLTTVPNRLAGGPAGHTDFVVNGRLRPVVQMQPGEVQLWRIANTAGRSAAYFQAPVGLQWRQIAQDGVQFADKNYRGSQNRPIYVAPGNRIDLLVQAPMQPTSTQIPVLIQNVMARGAVLPTPANPTPTDPNPGVPLFSVVVSGPPVTLNSQPAQMPFINRRRRSRRSLRTSRMRSCARATTRPSRWSSIRRRLRRPRCSTPSTASSSRTTMPLVAVRLGVAEEWTIKNTTDFPQPAGPDRPSVPHPHQSVPDHRGVRSEREPDRSEDRAVDRRRRQRKDGAGAEIRRRRRRRRPIRANACSIRTTRDLASLRARRCKRKNLIWWDVFAIPSGRAAPTATNPNNVIPGYFKMRSRFVDYAGLYVLHCHILIHEDRGMMFSVQVGKPTADAVQHH